MKVKSLVDRLEAAGRTETLTADGQLYLDAAMKIKELEEDCTVLRCRVQLLKGQRNRLQERVWQLLGLTAGSGS